MSDNSTKPADELSEGETYRLGKVEVTPAESDSAAVYEYSDLKRGGSKLLNLVFHTIHWPLYLLFIFPTHYTLRLILKTIRWRRFTPATRRVLFCSEAMENIKKIKFLTSFDRFVLYLRASRVFTPAQIFPFLSGTAPISADTDSADRPAPKNWDSIRQAVYERDNYHCVNCGVAGGPHGNAELHADHVIPRSRDGADRDQNLRTLCRTCHEARHARIFDEG